MDLIWLRNAWNAKPTAFSTYPPSSFLPPSFFLRLRPKTVWRLWKRGRKLCERRGDLKRNTKKKKKKPYIYMEKQEDRRERKEEDFLFVLLLHLLLYVNVYIYIYKPVCVKRICVCVIHVFERVSLCQCVEGTETDEEDRREMGRWGRGISREHQPQLSNGTTTFLTAAECNKDFSSCCIRLNSNRIRKKSIVLV